MIRTLASHIRVTEGSEIELLPALEGHRRASGVQRRRSSPMSCRTITMLELALRRGLRSNHKFDSHGSRRGIFGFAKTRAQLSELWFMEQRGHVRSVKTRSPAHARAAVSFVSSSSKRVSDCLLPCAGKFRGSAPSTDDTRHFMHAIRS